MVDISHILITSLLPQHAKDVAALHIYGIKTGFISSLGAGFVTSLYKAIARSKHSYGLVAVTNGNVVGFVAFATNLSGLYTSVLLRNSFQFVFLLIRKMLPLDSVKKAFETLLYPYRISKLNVPRACLLSIVVAPEKRGKGLSQALIREGFAECQRRGVDKIKVLVGADNKPANGLYQKCGFELVGQIENHGVLSNVYVARTNHFEHP